MSATTHLDRLAQSSRPSLDAHNSLGPKYSRAAGLGLGIFLLFWGPLAYWRWPSLPKLGITEAIVMTGLGIALLFPWNHCLGLDHWVRYFAILVGLSIAFAFIQVFDTLFQYKLAIEIAREPLPVLLQSIMVFIALMQPPAVLFVRRPHLLA